MKTLFKVTVLSATLAALSATASANLLINGSFENPDVNTGTWGWFTSANVPGWNGSNIEIWDNFSGVSAYEGSQFAELNAHPSNNQPFSIFQSFTTNSGQWYDLSFAYRARSSNSESFKLAIDNMDWLFADHTTAGWSVFSTSFQASGASSTISFTSVSPLTGTIGNFLDDVKVTTHQVAEPATLALLGLGLAGLGFSRRRIKNA
jgi:hypothetical protein